MNHNHVCGVHRGKVVAARNFGILLVQVPTLFGMTPVEALPCRPPALDAGASGQLAVVDEDHYWASANDLHVFTDNNESVIHSLTLDKPANQNVVVTAWASLRAQTALDVTRFFFRLKVNGNQRGSAEFQQDSARASVAIVAADTVNDASTSVTVDLTAQAISGTPQGDVEAISFTAQALAPAEIPAQGLPQPGDGVWVTFENGDIEHPVWLGVW